MKPEDVKVGMRVGHLVFGFGEVLSIRHTDPREVFGPEASIKFDRYGIKDLVLTFASPKMEPVPGEPVTDPIQAAIDALLKIWPNGITCEHQHARDALQQLEAAHIERTNLLLAADAAQHLLERAPATDDTALSRMYLGTALKALGRSVYAQVPIPEKRS